MLVYLLVLSRIEYVKETVYAAACEFYGSAAVKVWSRDPSGQYERSKQFL